jgi:hypothetical protein
VVTASRYPAHLKGEDSFVRRGGKRLSGCEMELVDAARRWSVGDVTGMKSW